MSSLRMVPLRAYLHISPGCPFRRLLGMDLGVCIYTYVYMQSTHIEFNAICRRHNLSVKGKKGELMQRVKSHFQQVYHF